MLIERNNGYLHVPLLAWGACVGIGLSLPFLAGDWRRLILLVAICVFSGLVALECSLRVKTENNKLTISRIWRRKEVPLAGAYVAVEHANRAYYRVVLSDGTAMTGTMLPGRCIRVAERIGESLNLEVHVTQELRDQVRKTGSYMLVVILLPVVAILAGFVAYFLFTRR